MGQGVQGGQQLALGEIAPGAENHHHLGFGHPLGGQSLSQRVHPPSPLGFRRRRPRRPSGHSVNGPAMPVVLAARLPGSS